MAITGSTTNVMVLLSGGIDSSACVGFYTSKKSSVTALFIDYGQASRRHERRAATCISNHFGIPLRCLSLKGAAQKCKGEILARNAFLLYTALLEFPYRSGIIAIGIHAGTPYFDCSAKFIRSCQILFDTYADGRVQIGTPFLDWTKGEIWTYSLQQSLPLAMTYSCELGHRQPCGKCLSCKDLEVLHAGAKHNN